MVALRGQGNWIVHAYIQHVDGTEYASLKPPGQEQGRKDQNDDHSYEKTCQIITQDIKSNGQQNDRYNDDYGKGDDEPLPESHKNLPLWVRPGRTCITLFSIIRNSAGRKHSPG